MKSSSDATPGFWVGYIDSIIVLLTIFILIGVSYKKHVFILKKERNNLSKKVEKYERSLRMLDENKKTVSELLEEIEVLKKVKSSKELKTFKDAWDNLKEDLESQNVDIKKDTKLGGYVITLSEENLRFDPDSCNLTPVQIHRLYNGPIRVIQEFSDNKAIKNLIRISIGGHTDSRGNNDYNMLLSYRRANAVAEQIKKYISKDIYVETIGYGSIFSSGKSRKDRKRDRRVTITIQPIAVEYL